MPGQAPPASTSTQTTVLPVHDVPLNIAQCRSGASPRPYCCQLSHCLPPSITSGCELFHPRQTGPPSPPLGPLPSPLPARLLLLTSWWPPAMRADTSRTQRHDSMCHGTEHDVAPRPDVLRPFATTEIGEVWPRTARLALAQPRRPPPRVSGCLVSTPVGRPGLSRRKGRWSASRGHYTTI